MSYINNILDCKMSAAIHMNTSLYGMVEVHCCGIGRMDIAEAMRNG